ncbi:hypothetical protein BDZ91DRAFT_650778 [Kalaharituber pfeilii]|nr:hypothetical protein BDZ91DRAFT_650778 [Kalaharituber pfeilii]
MEVCEAWFSNYEDEMDENVMSPTMANKWLEDLGISPEGATYYIIAWKMEAKSMLKLTKGEFVTGMTKLGVDSNEKLLDVLPSILEQTAPSPDAPEFRAFYKFIFNYSKSDSKPGAKNVELDVAVEFLNMVLDRDRYRIDYATRSQDDEMEIPGGRKADGAFPHVLTFIEFLKKVRPVKVINRDQWESFLPFNKSVGWELEGYSENGACEFITSRLP